MVLKHDCVRYIYIYSFSISFVVIIGRLDRRDHFYFHSLGVFEQQMQHRLTSGLSSVGTLKHKAHTSTHIQSMVAVKEIYYIFFFVFLFLFGRRRWNPSTAQHLRNTAQFTFAHIHSQVIFAIQNGWLAPNVVFFLLKKWKMKSMPKKYRKVLPYV